jgi:hypothetical protein
MCGKSVIDSLGKSIDDLMNLVESGAKFSFEEFSLLVSCLECLDRRVLGSIKSNGLLDIDP